MIGPIEHYKELLDAVRSDLEMLIDKTDDIQFADDIEVAKGGLLHLLVDLNMVSGVVAQACLPDDEDEAESESKDDGE